MIVGVGIDVVDVARFEHSLDRTPGLRARLFTSGERERPISSLAARFAAKEALAKALGAPVGLSFLDAEVCSGDDGRPQLALTGTVAARAEVVGAVHVQVSLSHDAGIASAVVILEDAR